MMRKSEKKLGMFASEQSTRQCKRNETSKVIPNGSELSTKDKNVQLVDHCYGYYHRILSCQGSILTLLTGNTEKNIYGNTSMSG